MRVAAARVRVAGVRARVAEVTVMVDREVAMVVARAVPNNTGCYSRSYGQSASTSDGLPHS